MAEMLADRRRWMLAALLIATPAAADPAPPAPGACAGFETQLTTDGQQPVLCWGNECRAYGAGHRVRKLAPPAPPPPVERAPTVTADGAGFQVCGKRCTPLGPRASEALHAAQAVHDHDEAERKDNDPNARPWPLRVGVTRDAGVITFHGGAVNPMDTDEHPELAWQTWNVARDEHVELAHPKTPDGQDVGAFLESVEPIGDLLVTTWTACAGPCQQSAIADRSGRALSSTFEAGSLVQQTRDTFVVVGENGQISVLDHGHVRAGSLVDGGADITRSTVRIDARRVAALVEIANDWQLLVIEHGRAKKLATLPSCPSQ
jgi:hypothetical protein